MALSSGRNTRSLGLWKSMMAQPVEAATTIYVGGLVMVDKNGLCVPGQRIAGSPLDVLKVLGICDGLYLGFPGQNVVNQTSALIPGGQLAAGAAGAISCQIVTGTFLLDIGGSSITQADIGALCYAEDDHTVYDTPDTVARPVCGTIVGLEGGMVWVDLTKQSAIG